jgi:RNA polymerase sigma-70 factor (ECF subfamily)
MVSTVSTPQHDAPPDECLGLLRQAQSGDFAAFGMLVDQLQQRVFGLAYRILGESHDAEDVAQQTFLSLIEHLNSFRGESTVRTWVLRIAANHALKLLRKRRGLPTEPTGDTSYVDIPHPEFIAPWRDEPSVLAEQHETRKLIDQALKEIDEHYREVFILRDMEGFSVKETAELLGISEVNVKVRLLRARLALRERLTVTLGDEKDRIIPDHHHASAHGEAS